MSENVLQSYEDAWRTADISTQSDVLIFLTKAVPLSGWRIVEEAVQLGNESMVLQGLVAALSYLRRVRIEPSQ